MCDRHGQAQGTGEWLEGLMLHRAYPANEVRAGGDPALERGLTDAGSVATWVRGTGAEDEHCVELDTHLGALVRYGQARAPSLTRYDALGQTTTVTP